MAVSGRPIVEIRIPTILCIGFLTALAPFLSRAELSQEQLQFFENKIRPVLVDSCYKCHSAEAEKIKGGLALDTKAGLLAGGDSGHSIVPGNLENSLLWTAIQYEDEDYEMPPKQKLPDDVIEDFRQWILMGAPDPRDGKAVTVQTEIDIEEGKRFWSFREPVQSEAPAVSNEAWPKSDIDRFILAKLNEAKLKPVRDASPGMILRRLYFDLIGLPPSPQQAKEFYAKWRETPKEAVKLTVAQLLESPRFGERWGRHWLDIARYAESSGKESNQTFPQAWRYRDYVIDAFNQDKPFDRFVREQIAGDLLPIKNDQDWQENLIATGFLALGPKSLTERNPRQFRMDVVDEQIDTMSQSILGLTVACARCHDHKSDPIPQSDYYAMAGIFLSTETFYGTARGIQNFRPSNLLLLPNQDDEAVGREYSLQQMNQMKAQLASLKQEQAQLFREAVEARRKGEEREPGSQLRALRLLGQIGSLEAKLKSLDQSGTPKSYCMGVQETGYPVNATLLIRGEVDKPAQQVQRGFLQVLSDSGTPEIPRGKSGRLEMAKWMTDDENPLTARVLVNRVWLHLFGNGLVVTPDNFGATGQPPTHPELLDYLAVRFMEKGWSMKGLIRDVVLSRTYQMSSDFNSTNYSFDPDNKLLWRQNQRRLDAESIRDAMLAASGKLNLSRPRASVVAEAGDVAVARLTSGFGTPGMSLMESIRERMRSGAPANPLEAPSLHRSVYLPIVRDHVPEALELFDFAEPSMVMGNRDTTTVPPQALYLMNDKFVIEQANAMAKRVADAANSPRDRINLAFLLTYGRFPMQDEAAASLNFFHDFIREANRNSQTREQAGFQAMSSFCQALFQSAPFRYLD